MALSRTRPAPELGHHGEGCSFDAILDKYGLNDPALGSARRDRASRRFTSQPATLGGRETSLDRAWPFHSRLIGSSNPGTRVRCL
jgi:hypothetical protein